MTQKRLQQSHLIRGCKTIDGLQGLNASASKNVAPDNGSTHKRDGKRDKNKGLGNYTPSQRVCQNRDEQPKRDTDGRH